MDFASFSKCLVTRDFDRNGAKVALTYSSDVFTPEFLRKLASLIRAGQAKLKSSGKKPASKAKKGHAVESDTADQMDSLADTMEADHKVYASLLASDVLVAWDITDTDTGEPMPITYENLLKLQPLLVKALYDFCFESELPKSTEIVQTHIEPMTISKDIEDGSLAAVNGVTDLIS